MAGPARPGFRASSVARQGIRHARYVPPLSRCLVEVRAMVASLLALLAIAAPLALSFLRNGDTTGPITVLGHIADLGAALSILSISAALGVALLGRFRVGLGSSLELLPFSVALGAGVLAPGILA